MITRETAQLLRLITSPLLVVDTGGRIVFANAPLCELLGREKSQLLERPLSEFSADASEKTSNLLRLFSGSGDWLIGSLSLRKADGSVENFPCKGAVLQRPSQEHQALVAIQLDHRLQFQALSQRIDELNREIRLRRQAEELLRERTIRLEEEITERKKTESELAFRNALLSTQQENSLDGILVVDETGKMISFNQRFIDIWRIPPEVMASRSDERARQSVLDKLVDPQGFLDRVRYLYEHREEKTHEDILLLDGRTLERYSAPMFGREGQYYGRIWSFRDITERKQAEEGLRAASRYARSLIEASLDPLVTISTAGTITDVNAAFELATGIGRENLIGTDFNRYFTEPEKAREGYLKVFSDNHVKDYPLAIRHASGKVMDVLYNATVFLNEVGAVQGVFAAARDITERKRAEDALRESEERFRTLADFTYDWEYWQGPDHEMWFVTPSCERITGYTREEFLAQPDLVDRIIHPDDRHLMERHLSDARHEDTSSVDFRIVRKDGGIRWIAHGCRAIYWHGDKFMGRRSSNRDITERKHLEMALNELNRNLERRVEEEVAKNREKDHILIQQSRLAAMGEMVHNIAHQWRQPLNALSIILSNIEDDYNYHELTAQSLKESARRARQLLQRMSTTVDDFRDFFRPDREPGEFDISQSVEDALFVMEASLKNNNIQVEKTLPKGLMVYGYSNQFAQTILNVLANAKEAIQQHRPSDGRIEISLSHAGDRGILAIQDNGGGIPEDALAKIFDPYFTTKEKGSGIGLYMSKMIIERNLNGTITIVNHGAGALASISLPLMAPAQG